MAKQLSPLEKEFLVKTFLSNPNVSVSNFCEANCISTASLNKWVKLYKLQGLEGLITDKKKFPVLPDGVNQTEENYKREILKLRIEVERFKKNYTVQESPDGTITYIHLKEKNLQ